MSISEQAGTASKIACLDLLLTHGFEVEYRWNINGFLKVLYEEAIWRQDDISKLLFQWRIMQMQQNIPQYAREIGMRLIEPVPY